MFQKYVMSVALLLGTASIVTAQTPKPTVAPKAPAVNIVPTPVKAPPPLKTLPSGLQYTFIIDKPGGKKPQEGDQIKLKMRTVAVKANMIMYDWASANKGKVPEFSMTKPSFKGDVVEAIALMSEGDSMIVIADADLIFKNSKTKKPDFVKPGEKLEYQIRLVSVKTKEQFMKEQQAQIEKQMKEQQAKMEKDMAKQKGLDETTLKAYFTKKNIEATPTGTGLYYKQNQAGSGDMAPAGSMVKMNYTGYLLDGTKFDSNEDTAFKHVTPFEFKLGAGNVIKGWDEGVAKMKKGEKGTLYIPSWMAYGANARPGGDANPKGIPANSCLIFDVELLDYSIPVDEESVLREYFAARQLTPTRTATGLYYNIEKEGTGELCKAGDKISMQYTGQLLDGTKFDSNVDTAFGHVQPFEFNLGQGQVIKGWDEGIALLKKGSKAKLYIPSEMAYGKTPFPGSPANPKGIPPGSILIFDVEVMDIKKP